MCHGIIALVMLSIATGVTLIALSRVITGVVEGNGRM